MRSFLRGRSHLVVGVVSTLVAGITLATATTAFGSTSRTSGWADTNCQFTQTMTVLQSYTRHDAFAVADIARKEGYHYGGGCWNNDDTDNSPGEPKGVESTHGEGPDCSGLVWHAWRTHDWSGYDSSKATWFYLSKREYYQHGPYSTTEWKAGTNMSYAGNSSASSKKGVKLLDAFVHDDSSVRHMGLFWYWDSNGNPWFIEAKGEDYGTHAYSEKAWLTDGNWFRVVRKGSGW